MNGGVIACGNNGGDSIKVSFNVVAEHDAPPQPYDRGLGMPIKLNAERFELPFFLIEGFYNVSNDEDVLRGLKLFSRRIEILLGQFVCGIGGNRCFAVSIGAADSPESGGKFFIASTTSPSALVLMDLAFAMSLDALAISPPYSKGRTSLLPSSTALAIFSLLREI